MCFIYAVFCTTGYLYEPEIKSAIKNFRALRYKDSTAKTVNVLLRKRDFTVKVRYVDYGHKVKQTKHFKRRKETQNKS